MIKNLKELPRLGDSITYLYLEHCIIEQDNFAIKSIDKEGVMQIPIAGLTVLMLGPGVSITHAAIVNLSNSGCLVVWCGELIGKFYALGLGETRSSKNLLKQAQLCMDKEMHLEVVKRMYCLRFKDIKVDNLTLEQIRGLEGVRVRTAYQQFSKLFGVNWHGRTYKKRKYSKSDDINKALSYSNSLLYALCHAIIVTLGYSTGLGFIHTGNVLSFVYDIADLYKVETTIPASFEVVGGNYGSECLERNIRIKCRRYFKDTNILKRVVKDLDYIFDIDTFRGVQNEAGALWTESGDITYGKNYG